MRAAVSEFLGTALLVTAMVGSGIMGERLSAGSAALLASCIATGAVFLTLISIARNRLICSFTF